MLTSREDWRFFRRKTSPQPPLTFDELMQLLTGAITTVLAVGWD